MAAGFVALSLALAKTMIFGFVDPTPEHADDLGFMIFNCSGAVLGFGGMALMIFGAASAVVSGVAKSLARWSG